MNFDNELDSMPEDNLDLHLRTLDKLTTNGPIKHLNSKEREQFRLNLIKRLNNLKNGIGTLKW